MVQAGEWIQKVKLSPRKQHENVAVPKEFYRELLGYAVLMGYAPGWAFYAYGGYFGKQPSKEEYGDPIAPSKFTKSFGDKYSKKRVR